MAPCHHPSRQIDDSASPNTGCRKSLYHPEGIHFYDRLNRRINLMVLLPTVPISKVFRMSTLGKYYLPRRANDPTLCAGASSPQSVRVTHINLME